ncbi:MAG: hypothetical protein JNL79_13635 [Myxococcales bacterium]|nr:hypothetical protein [Myxococcales bacterium]
MTRARLVASALVAAAGLGLGFLPLFAGPGYEHAIATGLHVPTVAAIVAALEGYHAGRLRAESPADRVARGMRLGALLAAIALATALVHGLRVGMCDPWGGFVTFALGPGLGSVLGGGAGAVACLVAGRRRWLAVSIAGLTPLTTALVAGLWFYFSPAVFAYDPYVGFFSGTLYDEVVDAGGPLLTYRAGTLATLVALVGVSRHLARDADTGRLWLPSAPIVGGLAAIASLALVLSGTSLGHRSTSASIAATLGGRLSGPRCDVVFPRATAKVDADLLLRDCEEELAMVEARLGARGPERVTAFFFHDAEQKRRLMGAAETYVAKPWRKEVYLQMSAYPHPVLGHELAHVVAGAFGAGPFRVAGGLFPNPGLVEGIAVFASPDRDELTPLQWARAMRDLELLPPLSRTFGGGFLAQNSSLAYTVAGAFVGHLYERGQGAAVRAWYGGARFDAAFGVSFAAAEAAFRASLDAVTLPPEAFAVAKARFSRPAIWGRRCPHVVERLRDEAERCRDEGDLAGAEAHFRALLRLDVADPAARVDLAKIAGLRGDLVGLAAQLRLLVDDPRTPTTHRNRVREALGDLALRAGRLEEAAALYDAARAEVLDDDAARTLDVKRFAATSVTRAQLFGRLLAARFGPKDGKDDRDAAMLAVAAASARDGDPIEGTLARYLVARKLVDDKAWDEASALLLALDPSQLAQVSPRLPREAARLLVVAACAAEPKSRPALVDAALARYLAAPAANEGRRAGVLRWAARCKTGL